MKKKTNTERVNRIIQFIEQLKVPSGNGEGEPFKLLKFQKDFISDVYGPVDGNKKRIVRRAILSLARKNGKTALIATLALVHLVGPEAILNGEIVAAATEREQAGIVFKYACQIVRADPELGSYIKIIDSTKTMVCHSNGSVFKAISAEAGSKFGMNISFFIYDELAKARNRELYDALDTASAARKEPLSVIISTQSNDPQHILSQLIDDGLTAGDPTTVCHLYAVPDDADEENIFKSIKLWRLANPALGKFRYLSEMKIVAKRAKRMPTFEASFRNLYLNQRIDAQTPLIPRAEWMGCKGDYIIKPDEGLYLALDLSGAQDLTSLTGVTEGKDSRVKAWFWKPEGSIKEHELRDRVPYTVWEKQGYIETTPGRAVQYEWVVGRIAKISTEYRICGIAFDRWRIESFLNTCNRVGVEAYVDGKDEPRDGAIRLIPWGQGFKDMAPAIDAFESAILERCLKHDGNPVLTWNISNAMTGKPDPAGNRKLDKSASRFRIDGAVTLAMALGLKARDMTWDVEESAYADMTKQEMIDSMAF